MVWHWRRSSCIEMPALYGTVLGLLLLMHRSSSVALPEYIKPSYTHPQILEEWKYPYPKDSMCDFPYIWQPSVGRCCYPVFNCKPGYGISFCNVDMGNDLCVECKNSFKQYHLVHSFDGVNATCFHINQSDEDECIVGETLPARGNFVASCGLPCVCNSNNCFYGDDPCRCRIKQGKCKSNQQLNRLTGVCEACPWYSFKPDEGCDACIVNESLWMSGSIGKLEGEEKLTTGFVHYRNTVPSYASASPTSPNVTVGANKTVHLPDIMTEETIALLPVTESNSPNLTGVIIGCVVGVVGLIGIAVIAVLIKRKQCHSRSGASSSRYESISQDPPIASSNPGLAKKNQGETEASLLNQTNNQHSNGHIGGQPVSSNYKIAESMNSPESYKSGNLNEWNQSASANNESAQETPAEQMEINYDNNNIERNNNLAVTEKQSGNQNNLTGADLVDLQADSTAVQIPGHKTNNTDKKRVIVNERQNIVHAETSDQPSSILFSSDSNNPCSSSHEIEKNLDGKMKIHLGKDVEDFNFSGGINQFVRGSPVENSCSWTYPKDDSSSDVQTLSAAYVTGAQNTVPQAISASGVEKRTVDNIGKEAINEFMQLPPHSLTLEIGIACEDTRISNQEPIIHNDEGSQHFTMPYFSTNASISVPFSAGDEDIAQSEVPQALCTGEVDKRTDENIGKTLTKEVVRVLPLNSSAAEKSICGSALSHENGTCSEDSGLPNEDSRMNSEQSPLHSTSQLSPITANNSSPFRPFLNRSISSTVPDRPMAKVTPMRQESQSRRQAESSMENDDSMSNDSSTDISMSYGVIHHPGDASIRDESLASLTSSCEDAPPSFSASTASCTQMENARPGLTCVVRSAAMNRLQNQMLVSQSRGGPDGASVPLHHRGNRVLEPTQVFETAVKEQQESEETDPKTLLSSSWERDRNEQQGEDSDSEDDMVKIFVKDNLVENEETIRRICDGLVCPSSLSDVSQISSAGTQGKASKNDFYAMGAKVSCKEINLRSVALHNEDNWSSESEGEENKLNSSTRSKFNTEETSDSYCSLQEREDTQMEVKSVEDHGKDGTKDPVLEESSSERRSSHSEDEGVCPNGDADVELNRDLQQPSRVQIDVHNELNSSSLSVNSDESGIELEEKNIQHLQTS